MANGYLRISEFSHRVGVSPERLRAWEKRYGLLTPERTPGGFRLYSDDDLARVQAMLAHLEGGASAAEAARLARTTPTAPVGEPGSGSGGGGPGPGLPSGEATPRVAAVPDPGPALGDWAARLRQRLEAFDDAGAHAVLDELLATFTLETVLQGAVLPCLVELGRRWRAGEVSVGQEHYASNLLRGRLLSLAQGWGRGAGPRAVLAAPPGEQHDLGLIACGLALARQGVAIVFLGADCPAATLADTVATVAPQLVVLSAVEPDLLRAAGDALAGLDGRADVYLGGAGSSPELAAELGATHLDGDVVAAAGELARRVGR